MFLLGSLKTSFIKYGGSLEDLSEVKDNYRIPYPAAFGSVTYPKPIHNTVDDNLQVPKAMNIKCTFQFVDVIVTFVHVIHLVIVPCERR